MSRLPVTYRRKDLVKHVERNKEGRVLYVKWRNAEDEREATITIYVSEVGTNGHRLAMLHVWQPRKDRAKPPNDLGSATVSAAAEDSKGARKRVVRAALAAGLIATGS